MTESTLCRVCSAPTETIYRAQRESGLTSSSAIMPERAVVDACAQCGHAQTRPLDDLVSYYSSSYNFKTASSEEDDLCAVGSGVVYRSELEAEIVVRALDLSGVTNVLDYGCGKAKTLRKLTERVTHLRPHVFDVSDAYRPYWDEFVPRECQASFSMPEEWKGRFDLVVSFFALEHVGSPASFVREIREALSPRGSAIVILPNMYQNFGDFIVVDHVNHFSTRSLSLLFSANGFESVDIDDGAQVGWYVVRASRTRSAAETAAPAPERAGEIAEFWRGLELRVREFEEKHPQARTAIYGSGIFGLFIASALERPENLACFLDRSPFRHGLEFFGAKVVAPNEVPGDVSTLYVGLNPLIARQAIAAVPELAPLETFFV